MILLLSMRKLAWVFLLLIQKLTLAISCLLCGNLTIQENDRCCCTITSDKRRSDIFENMICKNVQENSYLHSTILFRKLYFVDSNIKHLTKKMFTNVDLVEELYLNNTGIEYIDSDIFFRFLFLSKLHLEHNELTSIDGGYFTDLYELRELDLHNNQIEKISSFHTLKSLINLNLADNKITNFSSVTFGDLKQLMTLNISNNALKSVDAISHFNQLRILDISYNKIVDLPGELFMNLTNLKVLNISNNDIIRLHITMFRNLQTLSILSMHSLKLKTLDLKNLTSLSHLEELDLHSNNMKFSDGEFFNFFTNLKILSIDGNIFPCSVVANLLNNLKRRNVTIKYTQNYRNKNIEGLECTEEVTKVTEILSSTINHSKTNPENGRKALETTEDFENNSFIEKTLSNITNILLKLESSNFNILNKILEKIEQIGHNITISLSAMDISLKLHKINASIEEMQN
ncbi:hypothetical protein WA026_003682 [Henosepilachna vigintioctopunctata]|uniref:Uncharacterized protein n=1 Tax=Henosepilachna vigintioctopunctata TaxID=420089 RepID=A0AAW1U580_9CUCU